MRPMSNSRQKFSPPAVVETAPKWFRRGAGARTNLRSGPCRRRRNNRLLGVSSTTFLRNAVYEPFGPLQSFGYGNGLNLTRAYDQDYRLTGITLAPTTGAALLNLGFSWQTDGRLSGVTDSAGTGRAASYTYTNSGRVLTGVSSGLWGSDTYAYDPNGNLTQTGATASPVSITVATSSNRITTTALSGSTQRTFTYRTGGDLSIDNPAGASAFNYTYNAAGRLSGVSKGSTAKGAYGYDFAGRRVWRQTFGSGAAQTAYVFDSDGHVLAEENAVSGAMTKEYVWLDDALVGMFIVQSGATVARFVTTGQIDEPLVITQSNKNVAWSGYTDPYGNQGTLSGSAGLLDLRLPGQWYEAEGNASGLHQNGYRDYDPSLGRYIEGDPLGIDAGANLYGYVDGDPVNEEDPFGLCPTGTHPATEIESQNILNKAKAYLPLRLSHSQLQCNQLVDRSINKAYPGTVDGEPNTRAMRSGSVSSIETVATPAVGNLILFNHPSHVGFVSGANGNQVTQFLGSQTSGGPAIVTLPAFYWSSKISTLGNISFFQICIPAS